MESCCFLVQRSVDITPEMALQVIKYLRKEGVEFVVAPYEADAQLAALANLGKENGGIAAVITEDSDLLAYGCSKVRSWNHVSIKRN
jgi:exonuclease-1